MEVLTNKYLKKLRKHRKQKIGADEVITVPNNEEGQMFLSLLRKFVRTGDYRIRVRGRHPFRTKVAHANGIRLNSNHDIPVRLSAHFAIYIDKKPNKRVLWGTSL